MLAAGLQKIALDNSSSGPINLLGGVTEGLLPVNWRALLRDTAVRAVPDPAVQLELIGAPAGAPLAAGAHVAALVSHEPAGLPLQQQQEVDVVEPQEQQQQQHAMSLAQPAVESVAAAAAAAAPRRESAAVRHLKQACKQLQEAASIPVEVGEGISSMTEVAVPGRLGSIAEPRVWLHATCTCCSHALIA